MTGDVVKFQSHQESVFERYTILKQKAGTTGNRSDLEAANLVFDEFLTSFVPPGLRQTSTYTLAAMRQNKCR